MIYIRRTVKITAFILGLIALLLALSIMFIPKNNMKEFGMEEVAANGVLGEKENTIDVIILGDSEAYSSFSPMQIWRDTGYSVYVCGTSAQTLNYSLKLLQRATEKQNPKIVIQRLTGDPMKEDLIAPLWTVKKIDVLNTIDKEMVRRNTYQGKRLLKQSLNQKAQTNTNN